MEKRVAINGFGRIGRLVLRSFLESDHDFDIVAVNDLGPLEDQAHLFEYDSIHGRYPNSPKVSSNTIDFGSGPIQFYQEADPAHLPWKDLNIDLVFECSGRFTNTQDASKHLEAGAKQVIVSAPSPDPDKTIVYGVNHKDLTTDDKIISNASCTTNCLAPVAKVMLDTVGIVHGYMTTIHAYTADQKLVDSNHKDMRRARAAAQSMIPTSTGAAKAVGLVLPELSGKLDGTAIRVPTPNVSLIDFTFVARQKTTHDHLNDAIIKATQGPLSGILATSNKPLVSIDFNHTPFSGTFDLTQTQVIDDTFCRVVAWYDNEWGFANRMNDVATHLLSLA